MLALVQIPEMQAAPVICPEQNLRHEAVLHRVRRAPLARHHRVVAEMPPHIVSEPLRTPLNFPAAEHLEGLVIDEKHPAGAVSRGVAERRDVNAVRPAMHRMGPAVARRLDELFRLDDLLEFWIARVRLGVDDVDARGAKARHDQIAPLDMRVWRVRAKAGAAGVPAEMVQLVAWRFQAEVATRRRQRSRPAPWPPSAVKGKRSDLVSIAPLGVSMGGNAIFAAGSD